jgi:YidC/Oxa1 family membrane protein insertase
MIELWNFLLYKPLLNALIYLYGLLFNNFGLAIIVLTIFLRLILVPLTLPSLRTAKKMRELAPELEKLKSKYKNDRQKLAQAQMELYRRHGANPAAGCLPQIIQLIILIALYRAFIGVLQTDGGEVAARLNQLLYSPLKLAEGATINTSFLYLDLAKPDRLPGSLSFLPGLFVFLAAFIQFISSKMMQPIVAQSQKVAVKTETKKDDLGTSLQSQMLYLFPLITIFIGYSFPSGLILYWFIFSFSTALQQYFVSGFGGLEPWLKKLNFLRK